MRCQRCRNEDMNYFYQDEGVWYCRKCIGFGRIDVGKEPITRPCMRRRCKCHYTLSYPLIPKQQIAVASIMQYLKEGKDVLVYAACGFRVIIVTVANSLGNIRVFELLPKLKTKKYGWCIA